MEMWREHPRFQGGPMGNSVNGPGNNVDEIRYRSYLTQLERDQEATLREKEDAHRETLGKVLEAQKNQLEEIRRDFDVRISSEAETLERKLGQARDQNQTLIQQEHLAGEQTTAKIHQQYAQRIEQEKRTGEEQIRNLQAYYKKASDELHHQYEKENQKAHQKGKTT